MDALRRYSDREDVRRFAGDVAAFPIVQGLVLDLNWHWRLAWRIERYFGSDPELWRMTEYDLGDEGIYPYEPYDLDWSPAVRLVPWLSERALKAPVFARVVVMPPSAGSYPAYREQIEGLRGMLREAPLPTTLQPRPTATLAAASGDRIVGSGGPGTLGGVLKDTASGECVIVTCGHVASHGDVTTANGQVLGSVRAAVTPAGNPAGALCNPQDQNAVFNELDAALVTCPGLSITGPAGAISTLYNPGQTVRLRGASSGNHCYDVGGLAVIYRFRVMRTDYCFRNLFEVRPHLSSWIPVSCIAKSLAKSPAPGDSGAWVTTFGDVGEEWCGMLVGTDEFMGFAIDANTVHSWADAEVGTQFSVA